MVEEPTPDGDGTVRPHLPLDDHEQNRSDTVSAIRIGVAAYVLLFTTGLGFAGGYLLGRKHGEESMIRVIAAGGESEAELEELSSRLEESDPEPKDTSDSTFDPYK